MMLTWNWLVLRISVQLQAQGNLGSPQAKASLLLVRLHAVRWPAAGASRCRAGALVHPYHAMARQDNVAILQVHGAMTCAW